MGIISTRDHRLSLLTLAGFFMLFYLFVLAAWKSAAEENIRLRSRLEACTVAIEACAPQEAAANRAALRDRE